ncbi:hypothetical protein NQ314_019455 [Rhamnusium bicolor]|uniref:Uncharacterized protein n=1 Tax=Rhamnusium bicolor TaxID=1586634 RepID=A0AAV8WNE9_9CUCU|nr:hypothetical protein NQ314_019455 [Rhamnusium bicolor]
MYIVTSNRITSNQQDINHKEHGLHLEMLSTVHRNITDIHNNMDILVILSTATILNLLTMAKVIILTVHPE